MHRRPSARASPLPHGARDLRRALQKRQWMVECARNGIDGDSRDGSRGCRVCRWAWPCCEGAVAAEVPRVGGPEAADGGVALVLHHHEQHVAHARRVHLPGAQCLGLRILPAQCLGLRVLKGPVQAVSHGLRSVSACPALGPMGVLRLGPSVAAGCPALTPPAPRALRYSSSIRSALFEQHPLCAIRAASALRYSSSIRWFQSRNTRAEMRARKQESGDYIDHGARR